MGIQFLALEKFSMKDLKNFAILLFLIGTTSAQEKDSSTKLCDNEKGEEFFGKLDACTNLAEQNFFLNILDSDINKAACDLLSKKLQCWKTVDATYDCITDEEMVNIEGSIISKEIEKAEKSDILGNQYISSCGIITSYKNDFVNSYYGPNAPCTYDEIEDALDAKKTCENANKEKVKFLESFANSVDAWTRIFCLDKTGRVKCSQGVLSCKNSQQRAITERNNQKVFDEEERTIRGLNSAFNDFSYKDCDSGNRRFKRSALMSKSLSSGEIDQLMKFSAKRFAYLS